MRPVVNLISGIAEPRRQYVSVERKPDLNFWQPPQAYGWPSLDDWLQSNSEMCPLMDRTR